MESIEFIKSKIDELVSVFDNIKCRYEYSEITSTHFIEVLPLSFYDNDVDFMNIQSELLEIFYDKFPYEGLCFISEESLIKIESPIYEKSNELDIAILDGFGIEYFNEIIEIDFDRIDFINDFSFINIDDINNEVEEVSIVRKLKSHSRYINVRNKMNFTSIDNQEGCEIDSENFTLDRAA